MVPFQTWRNSPWPARHLYIDPENHRNHSTINVWRTTSRDWTRSTMRSLYFLYDRRLLSELSRCAWDALKVFFPTIISEEDAVPGAVIAIQTFGDFLGFNPHCHVLCTDGAFYGKGMFRVVPRFILKDLEKLIQYKVFKMLLSRKKITEDFIETSTIPCPSSESLPAVCLAGQISGFMLIRSIRRFTRLWRATLPDF